jgi:hypothetical protein
MAGEKPP